MRKIWHFINTILCAIAIFIIKIYQWTLSPFFGRSCRFNPTCSHYGIEAYRVHGFFKGSWLTIKRICACNPWGRSGDDPVPPKYSD